MGPPSFRASQTSCGAWSFGFLLPQYRGRSASQTRNTHGVSKALQYLKTQRMRPGSQQTKKIALALAFGMSQIAIGHASAFCWKVRRKRSDWGVIAFCLRGERRVGRDQGIQDGLRGIARLADACRTKAVLSCKNERQFLRKPIVLAARWPN